VLFGNGRKTGIAESGPARSAVEANRREDGDVVK